MDERGIYNHITERHVGSSDNLGSNGMFSGLLFGTLLARGDLYGNRGAPVCTEAIANESAIKAQTLASTGLINSEVRAVGTSVLTSASDLSGKFQEGFNVLAASQQRIADKQVDFALGAQRDICGLSSKIDSLGYQLSAQMQQGFCETQKQIHAQGEATRDLIKSNKICDLEKENQRLYMQTMFTSHSHGNSGNNGNSVKV